MRSLRRAFDSIFIPIEDELELRATCWGIYCRRLIKFTKAFGEHIRTSTVRRFNKRRTANPVDPK